jgi:hypothetical protein
MGLPPVPPAIQHAATGHDLGKIDWIQPEVIKNGQSSQRGTYFFQYGMIIASGRLRTKITVYPYNSITNLGWDLYITTWPHPDDGSPRFQQIRVWHIVFADGTTHTVEIPEAMTARPGGGSADGSNAERRVWHSIIYWSRGDVCQYMEDTHESIELCDRLVAHHDKLTIDGIDFSWAQVTNAFSRVSEENFSPKRREQTVEVIVTVQIPPDTKPISDSLRAYVGYVPDPSPTYRVFTFDRGAFDLPLFYYIVSGMKLRSVRG